MATGPSRQPWYWRKPRSETFRRQTSPGAGLSFRLLPRLDLNFDSQTGSSALMKSAGCFYWINQSIEHCFVVVTLLVLLDGNQEQSKLSHLFVFYRKGALTQKSFTRAAKHNRKLLLARRRLELGSFDQGKLDRPAGLDSNLKFCFQMFRKGFVG